MAFAHTWNSAFELLPPNTEVANQGAMRIRDLKVAFRERAEVDHFLGGTMDDGKHAQIKLLEQVSSPTVAAGEVGVYGFDPTTGKTEAFLKDEDGDIMQITSGASIGNIRGLQFWAGVGLSETTDTYTVESYTQAGIVIACGGGGGGGEALGHASFHTAAGGGGGASTGIVYVDLSATVSVAVTAGAGAPPEDSGTDSVFGSFLTAYAGQPGDSASGSSGDTVKAGGLPGGGGTGAGAIFLEGEWGGDGHVINSTQSITSGAGGRSVLGGGGQARRQAFAGTNGRKYGGGGSGGLSRTTATNTGGEGGPGVVILIKLG